jgi:UDP-GlcNAc:undecaprenyl-phosphate/decaprenyl-phosphate GlcNAc-1-phosphate transferase
LLTYALVFLAAAALSFLLAYPVRTLALYLDVVDRPDRRKMHQIPVPLMGGVAIFAAFAAVSMVALAINPAADDSVLRSYVGLLIGGLVIHLLGIYDDVRGLKAPAKFAGQAFAALVVVAMGARIDLFTNPLGESFEIGWVGIPLAIFWIVGVTNAVNLIDGLDGLAVGIGAIAALGMFAVAAPANPFLASMSIALAGACLGFLRHNFYPARIFLGDSGSMFIGFALAVTALHGSFKATTATVLFLPIIVLGVPLFDTVFAIFRRARRRTSPFKADREHIHHRLVRIGLHHRNVVLVLYFVCIYLALTAYSIAHFPYQTAFLFLVLLTMGGIIGLRTLQFIEERLEMGLSTPSGSSNGEAGAGKSSRPGDGGARRAGSFGTLLCEVGGFREAFGDPSELEALCNDVRGMLSRRIRVLAVVAEPTAPGQVLLLVRTEPLKPSLVALVRDGLAWYLDDHRDRLSGQPSFPSIRWIGTGSAPEGTAAGPRGVGSARSDASEEAPALPFREGRAGAASS